MLQVGDISRYWNVPWSPAPHITYLSTFGWLHQSEPSFSFLGLRCHTIIPCLSMGFGTGVIKCKGRAKRARAVWQAPGPVCQVRVPQVGTEIEPTNHGIWACLGLGWALAFGAQDGQTAQASVSGKDWDIPEQRSRVGTWGCRIEPMRGHYHSCA